MKQGPVIAALVGMSAMLAAGAALAQTPVQIRIGFTPTGDTQMVLIKLKPEIARHAGKLYTVELEEFRGNDMRFRAYLSGALDAATGSGNSVLAAASKAIDLVDVADLKGKSIGINALNSSTQLWSRIVLEKAGLNPDRDVTSLVMNFAAQAEALRSGKVDVAVMTQPFAHFEDTKGGTRILYTAKDAIPFDEELQLLFFKRDFLKKNEAVVRAFLEDLALATKFYLEKPEEARAVLVDAKLIAIPKDVYFQVKDYYRSPDLRVDLKSLDEMQETLLRVGYQKDRIDPAKIVDMSYLPK